MFVLAAARRNRPTADATEADVQKMVVRFMHGAADREGGRCARQKCAHEAPRRHRHAACMSSHQQKEINGTSAHYRPFSAINGG